MPTSKCETNRPAPEPALLRSALFVGGLALDGLPAALASGADAVCIDLEDAVPPDRKAGAREAVLTAVQALGGAASPSLLVRINSLRSLDGIADMHAFLTRQTRVDALVLPKVESADEVQWAGALADDAASPLGLICIIETTSGLANCRAIAQAGDRQRALFFGGYDMSTALGCEMGWEPLLYARSRVVHAAASAGLQLLDSPSLVVDDMEGLRQASLQSRALGMTGKTTKHAAHVAVINAAFTASDQEIAYARRAVAAFDADPTKAVVIEGKLVELPAIRRLRRLAGLTVSKQA